MSLAIHPAERRFNCAHTTAAIERTRPPLFEEEANRGKFVVWKVLGFGGRPNPLVFSRAASFACRLAQGLLGRPPTKPDSDDENEKNELDMVEARLQLYVDDPVITVKGTEAACGRALDYVLMLWLAMGIPLSWKKGRLYHENEEHRWIGILFSMSPEGAIMRLPEDFVQELLLLLEPACNPNGTITMGELEVLVGKAARVAHVVPSAKPFVGGLWGALAGARKEASQRKNLSTIKVPTRRCCYSAAWVAALLKEDGTCPLALERLVTARPPKTARATDTHIEFDASVFGGGAILRHADGYVSEYFCVVWASEDAPHLDVQPGDTRHQTYFEFLTLLLSLMVWGDRFVDLTVPVLGDNVGALSAALSLRGRGALQAVARELSWRKARRRWAFDVGHLPSEHNSVADALSRVADPSGVPWPSWALGGATAQKCPKISKIWRALPQ